MTGQIEHGVARAVPLRSDQSSDVEMVALSALRESVTPRLHGTSADHARLLAQLPAAELPPIIVHRATMRVIDGAHRVRAAMLRGHEEIAARFFDGDDNAAFVLAVEANTRHGLPLSLADRTAAAARIIAAHPDWSDRAIAAVSGLSHKTIGTIRRRTSAEFSHSNTRLGQDGRLRPLDGAQGRLAVRRLLHARPQASLREIARVAGVSLATAHDVRSRLRRGEDPLPPTQRPPAADSADSADAAEPAGPHSAEPASPARSPTQSPAPSPTTTAALPPSPAERSATGTPTTGTPTASTPATGSAGRSTAERLALIQNLRNDPSLRLSESGRMLLRMLAACTLEPPDWSRLRDTVPAHCAQTVANVARGCGDAWLQFATELEQYEQNSARGGSAETGGNRPGIAGPAICRQ